MRTKTIEHKGFANLYRNGQAVFDLDLAKDSSLIGPFHENSVVHKNVKATLIVEIEERPFAIYESDLEKAWNLYIVPYANNTLDLAEESRVFKDFRNYILSKRESK